MYSPGSPLTREPGNLLAVPSPRALAFVFGATLGVVTIALAPAWSPAGPLGDMLFATVVALPAWLALVITAFFKRNHTARGVSASA